MKRPSPFLRIAVAAGAAGGAAEMLWVAAYAGATGRSGLQVAQEVTASVFPAAAHDAFAPLLGVAIHMLLSVALGVVLAKLLLQYVLPRFGRGALVPAALVTLAGIWAFNFSVALPLLNASFVSLMPLAASLTSKLLFGAAMASVLRARG
jgi:hypothetical protein